MPATTMTDFAALVMRRKYVGDKTEFGKLLTAVQRDGDIYAWLALADKAEEMNLDYAAELRELAKIGCYFSKYIRHIIKNNASVLVSLCAIIREANALGGLTAALPYLGHHSTSKRQANVLRHYLKIVKDAFGSTSDIIPMIDGIRHANLRCECSKRPF